MKRPAIPSWRALLRRDYPTQVSGGFAVIFGLMALAACFGLRADIPDDRVAAVIFGLTFGVFAVGSGIYAAYRLLRIRGLTLRGVVVDGQVIKVDANSEDIWYMIVGFQWAGESRKVWQGTGTRSRFNVGDTVRLLVDPLHPNKAWVAET